MDLTHAYKVALEQTVKELFTDHQQQVLYVKTSKKQNASIGKKG